MRKFRPENFGSNFGARLRLRRAAIAAREDETLGRFLPSGLTLLGLCSGATAIPFALSSNWRAAVVAIVIAALFDTLDGKIARLLGADSKFGAQLDSLADLVSFGIAPAVLVYMWSLYKAGGAGWTLVLIFCVCSAIRLARFNIESDVAEEPSSHFTGVPTPAAACLILLPLILSFQFTVDTGFRDPAVGGAAIAIVSLAMVSRLPTPSLKNLHVPRQLRGPLLGFAALLLASAVLWPWSTLSASLIAYVLTIPVSLLRSAERKRRARNPDEPEL